MTTLPRRWMAVCFGMLASGFLAPARLPAQADMPWRKPHALQPGDTIMFVAPAGPVEVAPLRAYASRLEKAGYHVILPKNLDRKDGYLAGTDEERADEMNQAIRDPKVRAIFPCRGGYGLMRILDRIDYAALRQQPKIVTGYSDLTALHLAIARKARVISFHAPMPLHDLWRQGPAFAFAESSFRRTLFADQYPPGEAGYVVAVPAGRTPHKLVGGNLTLLCATLGTPYALEAKGNILFLEDVHEAPYRIDRYLAQLRLAGVLDQVAGVVAGNFSSKEPNQATDIERVLKAYFSKLPIPVIMNFPVGHLTDNATLPHGALVELDGDQATLRVLENPVQLDPR